MFLDTPFFAFSKKFELQFLYILTWLNGYKLCNSQPQAELLLNCYYIQEYPLA